MTKAREEFDKAKKKESFKHVYEYCSSDHWEAGTEFGYDYRQKEIDELKAQAEKLAEAFDKHIWDHGTPPNKALKDWEQFKKESE